MTGASDFTEAEMLDNYLAATAPTTPSTVYVGLHTTSVGDDDSGTECSGNGYARVAAAFTRTLNVASNSGLISFPQATGTWGTVTHFGIYDQLTGGNLLFWGTLDNSKLISVDDVPKYQAGELTVTID